MKSSIVQTLLCCCLMSSVSYGAEYYPFSDPEESITVTTEESDLFPVANLIQGPGIGIAAGLDDGSDDFAVRGQAALRTRGHNAAWLAIEYVTGDSTEPQLMANPIILDKSLFVRVD